MMKCDRAEGAVSLWIEGALDEAGLEELKAHLRECKDCAERFHSLLPLMDRDLDTAGEVGEDRISATVNTADIERFASSVMAALPDKKPASARLIKFGAQSGASSRGVRPRFSPVLAFAAAALFIVGLGTGIFFTKLNTNRVTIRFEISAPDVSSVHLVGNFNDWDDKTYALKRVGASDSWEIELRLPKGNFYVYNFVLDGEDWVLDPNVPLSVDDGFGGASSLLRL